MNRVIRIEQQNPAYLRVAVPEPPRYLRPRSTIHAKEDPDDQSSVNPEVHRVAPKFRCRKAE